VFGKNFVQIQFWWQICILHKNHVQQYTVINNGHLSEFFHLERGVRQGCPLSAYLFILALETLAHKIRTDKDVKGIKIGNREIKITLLADDATCILQDCDSVKSILNILCKFSMCSGLKINMDKTKAKYIGSLKSCDYYPHGLSWIKEPLETLGIVLTDTVEDSYTYNFEKRLHNLKNLLNIWKQRKLSLKGKITIINSLALSSLIYVSSVIDTPQKVINEVDKIIVDFLWNGGTAKI
jgi:hypothetical protein